MARRSTNHDDGRKSAPRGRRQMPIGKEWLRDFLSEMLAVEMGGVKLYGKALSELQHAELQDRLTEFLHQTEFHVEVCTEMLTAAGASADHRSAGAEAADHKAQGLISTKVPQELCDLNNIENLILAETKDHWNWEMLAWLEKKIVDPELRGIVTRAVREVRTQEKTHLNWNERALTTLAREAAIKAPAVVETEATEHTDLG